MVHQVYVCVRRYTGKTESNQSKRCKFFFNTIYVQYWNKYWYSILTNNVFWIYILEKIRDNFVIITVDMLKFIENPHTFALMHKNKPVKFSFIPFVYIQI